MGNAKQIKTDDREMADLGSVTAFCITVNLNRNVVTFCVVAQYINVLQAIK